MTYYETTIEDCSPIQAVNRYLDFLSRDPDLVQTLHAFGFNHIDEKDVAAIRAELKKRSSPYHPPHV